MDYTQVPSSANQRGNPQYHRAQTQTGQALSNCDTATMDPTLFFMDQNMFDQPDPELTFTTTSHVHESWARATNPQLGPRGSNMHQPSVNTAPPFASRQTTIPRREYHSENSASIRARFNNQFDSPGFSNVSAAPSTYSGQLSNEPSQSVQIAPRFPLVPTYPSLNEHPQTAGPPRTPSISQVQSQSEPFDSLPRKRTRGEDYEKNSDVEHSNGLSIAQPHPDSSESVLLEQNRIGFIRYWLFAFPEASVFNPKHTESLATLMNVAIETVQQLCNKLLRTQSNHLAGSVGNVRFPLEADNPLSVSLLEYVPQDTSSTSEFTAVVQWVERRGPRCKPTPNHNRLVRRGNKIYQCTLACGTAFARKEDWIRHELCNNYPQEGWICNLPSTISVEGVLTCSFCGVQNPDIGHSHPPHTPCHDRKTFKGRVFFREDHFIQHFSKVHPSIPVREQVRRAHFHVNSQFPRECGFCSESQFQSWQYRADHLAVHFKDDGKDMKDWRVPHSGGLRNASDDDDDDNGHDDDEEDDNEHGDNQDENNGEGAGNGNFQGHGGASNQHPGDSGYGSSGRSGTSSGNVNLSANSYQYTAQSNSFGGQVLTNAQEHREKKHWAPASDKAGKPEAPLSHLQASTPLPPQRSTKQSDFHNFQGPPSSTNQSILLVREGVNRTGGAKVSSEFTSKDHPESECIESHCKRPTHYHFTEKMKAFTNSIIRKFQPFGKKGVVTRNRIIGELHRKSPATAQRATRSNETVSTLQNPDEISFRAASTLASSSTLKVSCLEQRLLDAQIPWGTHRFIPADALDRIVTKRAIHEELDRVTDLSASDISLLSHTTWEYARKIFAILVCIGKGKLVSSFLSEGITDADLPISIPKGSSQQKKWITPIETCGGWSSRELDDFSRVQWYFLAPIFTKLRTQHYELDDNCVMPFIKDTEHEARSGGFSDVWEVVIHPAHQKFFASNENPSIALKRLHSRKEDDFKHEAYMLTALAQNQHHHLIKLLATYKFRGQYHFMFPYANSNLRQYWEQKEPHWSHETLNWMLKQMHGIASALHAIHNFHSATPNNRSAHNNSQPDHFIDLRHAVNFGEERFGRHGDLKPENILWVESVPGSLGILQIADLGLGTFHTLDSRSNVEAKSVGGSPTYVPPECALDLPISRAYDIWSLGCVFLEFIIWLLEGSEGLEKFANDRLSKAHDGVYDNSFFIVALRSDTGKYAANVRPAVREWIRDLRTHQRGSAFVHDLLDLIEQEMLVVRPQNRITSGRLSQKLKGFATMAATNESYVFQEFAVAKDENEIYCGGIPDFFDLYWTKIEKITGMPMRKKTFSDVPDLSAQPLAAYVVTKCAQLRLSATWSLDRELEDHLAQPPLLELKLASDLNDPILEHFASRMLSTALTASPIRHIARPGSRSPSVEGTESDETGSHSTELELGWVLGSPATSEASQDAAIFGLDQDHDDYAGGIANSDSILAGLELPEEYRDKPFFCDANDENVADIRETLSETLYEHTKFQARANAMPWTPDAEDARWPNSDELALAPSPGPAYGEYHSSIRNYTRRHHKIRRELRTILGSCKAQPITFGVCDETVIGTPNYQQGISPSSFTQCPSAYIETRGKQSQGCHDKHVEQFSGTLQQPKISRPVDCVTYSLETLVSIFHPSFLVSHLSRSSVSTLTTELYAPKDLVYKSEHIVGFNLGFGPPIDLIVCPFTPRNKKALYSYQKHEGKDKLHVQESLPIVVNLFSIESVAEDLDAWLDGIIDSEFGLSEYVNLMMLRQKDHHFSQVLKALISWYMASKNKLSEPAHQTLRPALKLLITTTLLSLVPKVTDLTESLFNNLHYSQSPAQTATDLSTDAPRLLTRQIKASIYHLQQQFLYALFCHFTYAMQLDADVKIAIAFLVAHVLDLVRNAGREFAKYSREFNSTVVVNNHDVTEYEMNMQTQLFERVWASVLDANRRMGGLAERLRNIDSMVKRKKKENEEHQFVSAILETVL